MRKVTLAAVLLTIAALTGAPIAITQRQPLDFRALYHMTLEYHVTANTGAWQVDPDPVRGLLDGAPVTPQIVLNAPIASRWHGKMGQDLYDQYQTFVVDAANTFTVADVHATFEYAPGQSGMGTFHAVGKIVGGTGMFHRATGSFNETGPFVTWRDQSDPDILRGKYNAAVTATIFLSR